jgi:membrane-bound ClpP family serine protease
MGANSQQGWALLLFLLGFTFLPAGMFALGPIFTMFGLACLIVSAVWFMRIKPLEHAEPQLSGEPVAPAAETKRAV